MSNQCPTGYPNLSTMLKGGYPSGRITRLTGDKELCRAMLVASAFATYLQGKSIVWISPEAPTNVGLRRHYVDSNGGDATILRDLDDPFIVMDAGDATDDWLVDIAPMVTNPIGTGGIPPEHERAIIWYGYQGPLNATILLVSPDNPTKFLKFYSWLTLSVTPSDEVYPPIIRVVKCAGGADPWVPPYTYTSLV